MVDYIINLFSASSSSFTTNGLGTLSDPISCIVHEEVNSEYELEMEYPINGMHYSDIALRTIIVTKPTPYSAPQAFRIYSITKPINKVVTINAHHISYDLSGYLDAPFTAYSLVDAFTKMKEKADIGYPFIFTTTFDKPGDLKVLTPTSVRSLLGTEIVNIWGGEYEFDNYEVILHKTRGQSRGVSIRYGKNLTDLKQEENCSSLYTAIYPYWYSEKDGLINLPERIVSATGTYDFVQILPVDFSYNWTEKPPVESLRALAISYMATNNIGVPAVSINVSFALLSQSEEYKQFALLEQVELGDYVDVEFAELGVSATARCVKTTYNVITNKYESLELGDVQSNIASTIVENAQAATAQVTSTKVQFEQEVGNIKIGMADINSLLVKTATIENLNATNATIDNLTATTATIEDLTAVTATIDTLRADSATIGDLEVLHANIRALTASSATIENLTAVVATIDDLASRSATIEDLNATIATIGGLDANLAQISTLLAGNITANNIKAGLITANSELIQNGAIGTAQIGDSSITDGKIVNLTAGKLVSGTIDTSKVTILGPKGNMRIANSRFQVFDNSIVPIERVSIGDINNDGTEFGLRVRGIDGTTTLFDEHGITEEGITDGLITNAKISSDADISGSKLLDESITGEKLVVDAITAREIAAHTITANEILANTITAGQIKAGSITAAEIATGTITASLIKAGELVVGTNVTMGPGAFIQWSNLSAESKTNLTGTNGTNGTNGSDANVPSYLKSTYIDGTSVTSFKIVGASLASYATAGNGDYGIVISGQNLDSTDSTGISRAHLGWDGSTSVISLGETTYGQEFSIKDIGAITTIKSSSNGTKFTGAFDFSGATVTGIAGTVIVVAKFG